MGLRYAAGSILVLLTARVATAHSGHMPIEHGVQHEVASLDHLMGWGALGVALAVTCLALRYGVRSRGASRRLLSSVAPRN